MALIKATHSPQWKDKGTYKEPLPSTDNVRVPRLEVDDATTYIDKDGSDNITLTDAVTGTKTLAQLSAGAAGDVAGPASSTDHAIARFDLTTGKILLNSGVTIDDSGKISTSGTLASGNITCTLSSGEGLKLIGTATGNANLCHIGWYDSNGTTRRGYIGDASSDDDDIVLNAQTGNLRLLAAGTVIVPTGSTIGNLTLANGSITDSGGAISFGNENLSTTGNCTFSGTGHNAFSDSHNLTTDIDHNGLTNTHANPYKLDDLAAPDDNTDLDFSISLHGLVPKGTNTGTDFLKDDGTWATPAGGGDVTGPASSTDNEIARQHSTTGKVLQTYTSNPPTISDTGDVNIDGDLDVENIVVSGNVDGIDVSAHDVATTGVHGAGGDTIATDADISTHAAIKSANATLGHVIVETGSDIDVDASGKLTLGAHAPATHEASHQAAGSDILYVPRTYVWFVKGTVATGNEQGATFRIKRATTIEDIELHVKTAPTGATLIVDINDGGTTVFDEGDSGTRPEIDISGTTEDDNHAFSDTALAATTELTMDVDQVGSTVAGADLTVLLHCLEAVA